MKFYIPPSVTQAAFRGALILKKQSPNILFGAGLAGVVTSTVMACKATLKLADELPQMKEDLEKAKEDPKVSTPEVYGRNTAKVVELYAPAAVVGTISVVALTGSHVVLTRRNASLMAAYAAVSKAYDEYRARVRAEHGEEKELHIYHAAENKGTKKEPQLHADPNRWSPYARFFDEGSREFQKNAELNKLFIQCQQTYAQDLLISRGHVFLNEVYDALGLPRSSAGAVVGWVISKDGDNYIDFGLFEASNADFINGYEPRVLLDFNVDGVIYDQI